MKVRVLSDVSFHDGRYLPGDELELSEDRARSLIQAGLCEEVVAVAAPVEAATLAGAPETAVVPKAKKRG
jgi:hypothetical protein